ncbi:MAG: sigma 54-interacting transcriptional regulator [Planctomycetes bacterium]|nr:sigma 54-interacting transcriptional regulator [Planctomycetota bacterium]
MSNYHDLLVPIWREASRHIRIEEIARSIFALLCSRVPLDILLVRRIEQQEERVKTVAVAPLEAERVELFSSSSYGDREKSAFLEGYRQGQIFKEIPAGLAFLLPVGLAAKSLLAVVLGGTEAPSGLLLLRASSGKAFKDEEADLAGLLAEPFGVALENDLRLHEMSALREAAEADRRTLLCKLGRKELGDTIIGEEGGLHGVMERVQLVAPSDAPVLILGETGSGKELVARAIHQRSPRADRAFIRVNCGAIPPELVDSELFGHEQGAFTGALRSRLGFFERADRGTLFLDEIGDLPLAAQVRLLRILQDGWMQRVGGEEPVHLDVRIVAATHRDLARMVREGSFREDLWYRLAVFPVLIPSLRERREDIAKLACHFAERAATRFGLPPILPGPEDLALLCAYEWPGNVRELASVLDRAAILGDGRRLEIAKALSVAVPAPSSMRSAAPDSACAPGRLPTLDQVQAEHIEKALLFTAGRIEGRRGAAEILGINPHTLRGRMRRLGMDWRRVREGASL